MYSDFTSGRSGYSDKQPHTFDKHCLLTGSGGDFAPVRNELLLFSRAPNGGHIDVRSTSAASDILRTLANILTGAFLLTILAPLFVIVGLAIKAETRGPILFRQERHGRSGSVFSIYKFRTMRCMESGTSAVQCRANDPRVTRVGAFLRRTSIDELPQFLNVVRGEMAIVGPRPHPISLDRQFAPRIPAYNMRYWVKPGLTGLAQIRGQRGPAATLEAMSERIASDIEYVRRTSVVFDLWILFKTIPAVIRGQNAV